MNYFELIYLKDEFKHKLIDGCIERSLTPFKNVLEIFIKGKHDNIRLIFSTSPGNISLFYDSYRPSKRNNTVSFFDNINGVEIQDIAVAENDRFLFFEFKNGMKLWFRLFSHKANALLVDGGKITDVFKGVDDIGGDEPTPDNVSLFEGFDGAQDSKSQIISLNPLLPRPFLSEIASQHNFEQKAVEEKKDFVKWLTNQISEYPEFRLLQNGETTLWNSIVLDQKTERYFDSVNELIAYRYKNDAHNQRLNQQKRTFDKILNRQIKRLEASLKNLEKADKGIEKAEHYKRVGHLLMANAHLGKIDANAITVSDFYNNGEIIDIEIDPKFSIAENAKKYYSKSSNATKSYEQALKRIPELEEQKIRLSKMVQALAGIQAFRDFEEWQKKFGKQLETLDLGKKKHQETNLPFHILQINGYTIWIGKNAKSNDKLVQLAHKEDVWMHARGVPGSHLLIRMKNDKGMPDKQVIEEAASYAAFNSKARGSKMVPVIVSKRKYIRKPKGAAPGAVLVQKEEVELVTPKNPKV